MEPPYALRLGVYTDYPYHRRDGGIYAERAFALFLTRMASMVERLVVVGRLDPGNERARYRVGETVDFVPLPFYPSLANPLRAGWGMLRSLGRLWRALDDVDGVWLLGPHPVPFVLAAFAVLRRKHVALGVRQDLPAYVRHRHPHRPLLRAASRALDLGFRLISRRCATVVVGPDLARRYRRAGRLLETTISLVEAGEIVDPEVAAQRSYEGELTVLSVGRIDREKNPLILAEVLSRLVDHDPRWRLVVCGEGPMEAELAGRLAELGIADRAELRGYVPLDRGLRDAYRESHAVLHASWTEGVPQIIYEAFAAATPVVATDVGGVRAALGGAVRLVPPGDPHAAASELDQIASNRELRLELIRSASERVRRRTLDASCESVVGFLAGGVQREAAALKSHPP